jgi:beta-N-acetylhexosaminidase
MDATAGRRGALSALLALFLLLLPASANAQPQVARPPTVDQMVAAMTLPQKVGQLFSTYVYGSDANAPSAADVAENRKLYGVGTPAQVVQKYHLGGVIYFSWSTNLNTTRQMATLSNGLQTAATSAGARVPLIISTDQEHGIVVRLPAPATQFPGNMALGAGRSLTDAFSAGQITGRELRAVGITQAFAPVADVNVNPANPVIGVRSFSSDAHLAAALTASQVFGLQWGANAAAAAKHFPGHGDTATDSHTGLPVITHTRAEWDRIDAPPFRAAVAAGVDAIMSAHIVVPALDPSGDPATLSAPILTGLLRGELGYRGVIVTDSLAMAGVRQQYGDDRVPVLAIKAGADVLLMPPNFDLAYNAVLNAVASGELTEARIDQSVRRILALKQRRGLLANPLVDAAAAESIVGRASHLTAAQQITNRTVTAIRNDAGVLPLAAGSRSILVTGWNNATYNNIGTLATRLGARGNTTTALPTGSAPTDATIASAVAAAGTHDVVVVQTQNADRQPRQQALVAALVATGKPVVVAAVRDPYDINRLPTAQTYLATFSYAPPSIEALAAVIVGEVGPRGRLPVAIPRADDPATALYPLGHGLNWSAR